MTDEVHDDAERLGRVTNQDLARRMGRVELVQEQHGVRLHELANDMNLIALKVDHSQEMIRVRFGALEAVVASAITKIDSLLERSQKDQADPAATPAGRELKRELEAVAAWQRDHQPMLEAASGLVSAWRILAGGSVLTALALIITVALALGLIRIT